MCAAGQIAINLRGLDLLQARPGESYDDAWGRMKGKIGTGRHLDETTMHRPGAVVTQRRHDPADRHFPAVSRSSEPGSWCRSTRSA